MSEKPRNSKRTWMQRTCALLGRVAILVAVAAGLAAGANAVSPSGISWSAMPMSPVEAKSLELGIVVVDTAGVQSRLQAGTHLVLDARPRDAFEQGHLPGAVSCPSGDDRTLGMLQPLMGPGQPVLVYCSGSACDDSLELAETLAALELGEVELYVGGVQAWTAAGLELQR